MASGDEYIEEAAGPVNGSNQNFSTSRPYEPGSLYFFAGGILLPLDDSGAIDEIDPPTGAFQLREAPLTNDKVLVRYIES